MANYAKSSSLAAIVQEHHRLTSIAIPESLHVVADRFVQDAIKQLTKSWEETLLFSSRAPSLEEWLADGP